MFHSPWSWLEIHAQSGFSDSGVFAGSPKSGNHIFGVSKRVGSRSCKPGFESLSDSCWQRRWGTGSNREKIYSKLESFGAHELPVAKMRRFELICLQPSDDAVSVAPSCEFLPETVSKIYSNDYFASALRVYFRIASIS